MPNNMYFLMTYNISCIFLVFFKSIMKPDEFFVLSNNQKLFFLKLRQRCFCVHCKFNFIFLTERIRDIHLQRFIGQIYVVSCIRLKKYKKLYFKNIINFRLWYPYFLKYANFSMLLTFCWHS